MPPRKTRTFNQWQSMQKAKSNGKREKKFFFPACQLERARVLGFLAKHLAAIKGNKGSEGMYITLPTLKKFTPSYVVIFS